MAMVEDVLPKFDANGIIFSSEVPRAGEKLKIECKVVGLLQNERTGSLSWMLRKEADGSYIELARNSIVVNKKDRLIAQHKLNSNIWSIIFDPLTRDDSGVIECRLMDYSSDSIHVRRNLTVYVEPKVAENSTRDIEVIQGTPVNLSCSAFGIPQPTIEWLRADGKPLPNGLVRYIGEKMEVKEMKKEDRSVYVCVATNLIGSGALWTLKVNVKFPPYIDCHRAIGQAAGKGVNAYLECYVHGYPSPQISWYFTQANSKAKKIWNTPTYRIDDIIPEYNRCTDCVLTRLTVLGVLDSHYGEYSVMAISEEFPDIKAIGTIRFQFSQYRKMSWKVSDCRKIFGIGRNFVAHAKELGNAVPSSPILFMKPNTALIEENEKIKLPNDSVELHHEIELGVIVRENIPFKTFDEKSMNRYVKGYVLALDMTDRNVQKRLTENSHPWLLAKGFDNSCPVSKFINFDQIRNTNNVQLKLMVNGSTKQNGNTECMIWKVRELMKYLNQFFTLEENDLILMGTPEGVSAVKSGDELSGEMYEDNKLITSMKFLVE
ncbi:hypothetical protein SNEBB_006372 [Seison nebaliae]|nr:hypothetical protein SNEBB_006372 [Seison nebaliae]